MKLKLVALSLLCAVTVYGQGSQTPIYNGLLQSDLNAANYKITLANLVDYAGTGMTWNATTKKFDVTAGAGSGTVTSFNLRTGVVAPLVGDYSAFYQPLDADLTTWAGVTPTSGIQTWLATPSSANLRGAVTDENGTGALLFSGATNPDFTTGITIGGAALNFSHLAGDFALTQTPSLVASSLMGRGSASGAGDWERITIGSGLSLTGTVLAATAGGGGTVTDFSAGDLSPLFTTTEATTTTTPALSFALTNAAATTVFGRAAGTSGAPTYSASPQFTAIGNLTTNGFVKTGGGVGTLSVDTSTYLTANQNISLTGDVTGGPSATSIATTIGANKVTLGMMAQMATDSILGRKTAATGNVEVLTALPWADTGDVTRAVDGTATTLANIPLTTTIAGAAGARGDVLYYGASGWAKLAAGTNGNQLTTHAAGADPTWDAPGTGGGGTPGGSNTQVQFNDSSAFGGDADFVWDKTLNKLTLSGGATADSRLVVGTMEFQPYALNNAWFGDNIYFDGSGFKYRATGAGGLFYFFGTEGQLRIFPSGTAAANADAAANRCQLKVIQDGSAAIGGLITETAGSYTGSQLRIYSSSGGVQVPSNSQYAFSSTTDNSTGTDTGIARNAAGVVEINNGTAGTYRDLKLRNLTFSALATGLLEVDGSGNVALATAGTDYVSPTGTATLTNKRINPRVTTITSNATLSPNGDTDDVYAVSALATNVTTISAPTGTPVDMQSLIIRVISDSSVRTITGWNAIYRFSTANPAPSTTVASTTHTWGFKYNVTTAKWDCLAQTANP